VLLLPKVAPFLLRNREITSLTVKNSAINTTITRRVAINFLLGRYFLKLFMNWHQKIKDFYALLFLERLP